MNTLRVLAGVGCLSVSMTASVVEATTVPLGPQWMVVDNTALDFAPYLAGCPEDRFLVGFYYPFGGFWVTGFHHDGTSAGGFNQVVNSGFHTSLDPVVISGGGPGEFVVMRESLPGPMYGSRTSLVGQPIGEEFQMSSSSFLATHPDLTLLPGELLLGAWSSEGSDGDDNDGSSIQGRSFSLLGAPLAPQFQVNDHTPLGQFDPDVAINASYLFVVVWTSETSPGNDADLSVQARLWNFGWLGPQFQVNTTVGGVQSKPRVALQEDGDFLVVWESDTSPGNDNDSGAIVARAFGADGTPFGPDFQVNVDITGEQAEPAVVTLPDDQFEVVWNDDGLNIKRRTLAGDGTPLSTELQANSITFGDMYRPEIATGLPAHAVAIWNADVPDAVYTRGRSFTQQLFADGFESGDTSAWSNTVP